MCGISLPIDEMDSMGAFPGGSDESLGQSKEATTLTIIHYCSFQRLHKLWKVLETFLKKRTSLSHSKILFELKLLWTTQHNKNSYPMPILSNVDLTIYVFALFGCGKSGVCQNCVPVSQDKIFLPITILVPDVDHSPWSFFCKLEIGFSKLLL